MNLNGIELHPSISIKVHTCISTGIPLHLGIGMKVHNRIGIGNPSHCGIDISIVVLVEQHRIDW